MQKKDAKTESFISITKKEAELFVKRLAEVLFMKSIKKTKKKVK